MLVGSFDAAVAAAITEVAEQRGVPSVVNIDAAPQITDHVAGAQRLCVAARVGVGLDPVEVVDGAPRAEDDPVAEIDDPQGHTGVAFVHDTGFRRDLQNRARVIIVDSPRPPPR